MKTENHESSFAADGALDRAEQAERALVEVEKERDEARAACAKMRAGISALTALLIEHHASSDDGTGSLVCDVCRTPQGRLWWKQSDDAKDTDCGKDLLARIKQLEATCAKMREALKQVAVLIDQSHGVAGLHLNGDLAPWSELLSGGRFEGWLPDVTSLLAHDCGTDLLAQLEKAKELLTQCVSTGWPRDDRTRQLWEDIHKWLKEGK